MEERKKVLLKAADDIVGKNFPLVTPENDHSCNISFGLNNFILSTMQADYDIIKTVKFWSGCCASQFRSQFAFFMLSKFDHSINIEWNYFEANHGKGVVDGIGGTVKHAVYSHVLTNRVAIKSPKQFAKYANEILPKITDQCGENESMELGYQSECQEKAKKVNRTLKVHCVKRFMQNSSCQLKFFMTSKSLDPLAEVQYQVAVFPQHVSYKIETYVLVQYEGELWPGQVTKVEQDIVRVKCFQKAAAQASIWRGPHKPDEGFYQIGDVEQKIETPLDTRSTSSSLRSSNLLVRVAELDYLYK